MLFSGTLQKGNELPLVEALIQAGADLNFNKDGKSETPLIGAASLGAEDVGLRLLDAGARPDLRGLFGETALHALKSPEKIYGGRASFCERVTDFREFSAESFDGRRRRM